VDSNTETVVQCAVDETGAVTDISGMWDSIRCTGELIDHITYIIRFFI